jgi:hypothetical protein
MRDAGVASHAVRHVEVIHGELFVLSLERNGLEFVPGDCVALHTDGGKSRPYSIASGNREDTLRFVIRKMAGGEVSPWLMGRSPGDIVQISPPFGWFRPAQDLGDAPFVQTRTIICAGLKAWFWKQPVGWKNKALIFSISIGRPFFMARAFHGCDVEATSSSLARTQRTRRGRRVYDISIVKCSSIQANVFL